MTRLLVLAAATIVVAAVVLAATGPRPTTRAPRPTATAPDRAPADTPPPAARDRGQARRAGEVAVAYALAARNFSARTAQPAWRRQRTLAGGRLRAALGRARPGRSELARLEAERASQLAVVLAAPQARVAGRRARMTIALAERTAASGQAAAYETHNRVSLHRTPRGWRVTGWTTLPDPNATR